MCKIKLSKKTLTEMKKIYDLLNIGDKFIERSLAGICYDLGFEFRKKKASVIKDIDNLCVLGFKITERETENNIYYGVLPAPSNDVLYKQTFLN